MEGGRTRAILIAIAYNKVRKILVGDRQRVPLSSLRIHWWPHFACNRRLIWSMYFEEFPYFEWPLTDQHSERIRICERLICHRLCFRSKWNLNSSFKSLFSWFCSLLSTQLLSSWLFCIYASEERYPSPPSLPLSTSITPVNSHSKFYSPYPIDIRWFRADWLNKARGKFL